MDRFTWAFVGGILALCVLAVAGVFIARAKPPPPASSPAGVVTAYVQAVRDRDPDRAWDLLAPGAAVGYFPPPAGSAATPQDTFRRQMAAMPASNSSRIRILNGTVNGQSARVQVEVTTSSGGSPLFGSDYSRTLTFTLKQIDGAWRIDTAPTLYEIG